VAWLGDEQRRTEAARERVIRRVMADTGEAQEVVARAVDTVGSMDLETVLRSLRDYPWPGA